MSPDSPLNRTNASTVKSPAETQRLGLFPKSTTSSIPSSRNACPTRPGANVAPPSNVPLLPSAMSIAFPSPGHHEMRPDGGGTQSEAAITKVPTSVLPPGTGAIGGDDPLITTPLTVAVALALTVPSVV